MIKRITKRFLSLLLAALLLSVLLPAVLVTNAYASDYVQLTALGEAQMVSSPAIQPQADAGTSTPATFRVGGQTYADLGDAIAAAQSGADKTIVVATDGALTGSYTIPAGVTLLVPFDDAATLYKETPKALRTMPASKVYRKLVLAGNAVLTVEGAISVGGQYYSAGGSQQGRMVGNYGHLWLNTGAAITVKNGGALYAWGFVSGNGTVAAEKGSKVYEWFQVGDFRGGSATMAIAGCTHSDKRVFPLSQYYIQNIEAALTVYAGAEEILHTDIYANDNQNAANVNFIGSSGMFNVVSGSLTKQYDPAKDRMVYTVNGQAELNSLKLNLGIAVDSSKFVLPITNNMTLHITPRSSITTKQDIALLPGVQVYVDKAAELTIAAGKKAYIYDSDQWTDQNYVNPNVKFKSVGYSPTKSYTRTNADLVDAHVDVNGTLIAAGSIYTTKSGADVCSSQKTGRYIMKATSGTETITYQFTQIGSNVTPHNIPIDPIRLKNNDGSYTATKGKAQDQYNFEVDKWVKCQRFLLIFDPNYTDAPEIEVQKLAPSTDTPLNPNTFTRVGYTFDGWNTQADGQGTKYADGATIKLTADTTLYAQWKINQYTITFDTDGGTSIAPITLDYGTSIAKPADPIKTGYTFAGWESEIPGTMPAKDLTIKAKWTVNKYTVTWKNWDGTVLKTEENVSYGTIPEYNGEIPTKVGDAQYTYTFKGWSQEIAAVTGDTEYTAVFEQTVNTYTVTWKNWDGSLIYAEEADYGTVPKYKDETPKKASDAQYSYEFAGWTPEIAVVTGDVTYTATFRETVKTYTVTWVNWDGALIYAEEVSYGTKPEYKGDTPERASNAQYTYTFANWTPEIVPVTEDTTYTATFTAKARVYTVTWKNWDGSLIYAEEADYGTAPKYKDEMPEKASDAQYSYKFAGWTPEIAAVTGDVTYTATFDPIKNGWFTDETGRQYYKDGELQKTGWTVIDGNTYYLDTETGYAATGITTLVPDGATEKARCVFDAEGVFQSDVTGVYSVGEDTYWLKSGIVEEEAGLKRVVKENGEVNYYYFAVQKNLEEREGLTLSAAVKASVLNGQDCWLHKTNNLPLPEWGYYFDENGVILHDEDTSKNGVHQDGDALYYYVDGIKAPAGMVKIGDDYYYANSKGQLIVNQTYYCSRMNGLMEEGTYAFDAEGKLIPGATDKNGIVKDDDGVLRYYVNGKVTYVGLIEIDGDFYYVRSNGEVVTDCVYWITWTHGLKEAGYYKFDETGKMIGTPKNGIVRDDDGVLRYYVNDELTYAGLIKIGEDFYYVNSKYEVVHDCDYTITWTHGLKPQGKYHFDADGKLTGEVAPLKNGIYEEDGSLYFYRNGERTYAGLIQIDGDYYYVRSTCEVVHDRSYYVYWTHGLMPEGYYNFDSAGRMILDSETE